MFRLNIYVKIHEDLKILKKKSSFMIYADFDSI